MNAIQIKNVTKQYKDITALDDVSFSFEHGKIYGFLGRNGAGKSTLINIIANRIFADSGEVLIDNIPAKENMKVHDKVFCMSEADLYDTNLKIKDLFKWIDRFYDDFNKEEAFEVFDVDNDRKRFWLKLEILLNSFECLLQIPFYFLLFSSYYKKKEKRKSTI